MAVFEKRSGNWRAKIRVSGSPFLNKTFTKKSDAVRWAAETERAVQLGSLVSKDCTVRELLQRYANEVSQGKKSVAVEGLRIRKLNRSWLANILVSEIRPHHIAKFRDERLKQVSATTCLRDLSLLSNALTVAAREWGYNLTSNPVSKIRKPIAAKARTRRLEKGEEERLLESCRKSTNHWFLPLRNRHEKRRDALPGMEGCSYRSGMGAFGGNEEWNTKRCSSSHNSQRHTHRPTKGYLWFCIPCSLRGFEGSMEKGNQKSRDRRPTFP